MRLHKKILLKIDMDLLMLLASVVGSLLLIMILGQYTFHWRRIPAFVPDGWGWRLTQNPFFSAASPLLIQVSVYLLAGNALQILLSRRNHVSEVACLKLFYFVMTTLSLVMSGMWFTTGAKMLYNEDSFCWDNLFLPVGNAIIIYMIYEAVAFFRHRRNCIGASN